MPQLLKKSGAVLHVLLGAITVAAVVAAAFVAVPSAQPPAQPPGTPTARELRSFLGELGLLPGPLAAAGVSAVQTTALVSAAREHMTQHSATLPAARERVRSLRTQIASLANLASTGRATQQQHADLQSLRGSLNGSEASLAGMRAEALAAITAGLNPAQRSLLATFAANAGREVPMEYLAVSRTDAEWVTLRDSLIQRRVDTQNNVENSEAAARVTAAQGDPSVTAARNNLAANADAVASAWATALGN